jgi:hypothetical protein
VDVAKFKILIEESKVTFTPETWAGLEDRDLQVLFVATNYAAYKAEKDRYQIDDDFRAKLLRSQITDAQKLALVADMEESFIAGTPSVAADVGPLLDKYPAAKPDYGVDFITAVILNSRPIRVQISLFNKLHSVLSTSEIRAVLRGLPGPFPDMAAFGKTPRIENNDINRQLVAWLDEDDVISSFGETFLKDEIKIFTYRRER